MGIFNTCLNTPNQQTVKISAFWRFSYFLMVNYLSSFDEQPQGVAYPLNWCECSERLVTDR